MPKAEGKILSEGPTYHKLPESLSIIVLLYLHWLKIKYSIQSIHKQTDHDPTGLNLDELILDEQKRSTEELDLVWIDSLPFDWPS